MFIIILNLLSQIVILDQKQMVKFAGDQIEIMTGGGVNASNIKKIISEIKPSAIHFSGTAKFQLDEESMFSENILKVDSARVKRILDVVGRVGV